jgi:periplasmic protein TonB
MDYARQQRDPTKHVIGIAFVVLMHVLVIYALVTGLGKQMLQVIKKPMSATIIEEIKPPPPPPPPPPKKLDVPPPPPPKIETFVPPPDVPVVTESAGPTITVVTPEPPPPKPAVIEAPPPPPPPPKPAVRKGIVRLAGDDPIFPRQAIRAGVERGRVLARVMIDEKGLVTQVIIISSEPSKVFDQAVIDALKDWKFNAEGEKYVGEIEINFKLQ